MFSVVAMLGMMFFTWIVAVYATNRNELRQKIHVTGEDSEKAA
jgi:hypothetical protein